MGAGFYDQLKKVLLANGCFFVRQGKGSHEIWKSPINASEFPVAVTIMSRSLANDILKQAGIKRKI